MIKEEAQQKALATIWRSEMGGEAWVWVCVYGGGLLWSVALGLGLDGMVCCGIRGVMGYWGGGFGGWVWRLGWIDYDPAGSLELHSVT